MNGRKIKQDAPEIRAGMRVGTVVRSVSGRDAKRVFVVVGIDEKGGQTRVVIANGSLRTLADGKHKNPMHLRVVGQLDGPDIIELTSHPTDGRIAELCERFEKQEKVK